jgi:hypothetical protein
MLVRAISGMRMGDEVDESRAIEGLVVFHVAGLQKHKTWRFDYQEEEKQRIIPR